LKKREKRREGKRKKKGEDSRTGRERKGEIERRE